MTTTAPKPGRIITLVCGHEFATWGRTPQPGESLWCLRCDGPSEAAVSNRRCVACAKPLPRDSTPRRKACSVKCRLTAGRRARQALAVETKAAVEADQISDMPDAKRHVEMDGFTASVADALGRCP